MKTLTQHIGRAIKSLVREPWPTAMSLSVIAVCLLLLQSFLLAAFNLERASQSWTRSIKVHVFLDADADDARVEHLQAQFSAMEEAVEWTFINAEQAKTLFLQKFPGRQYILDGIDENPFPRSFEIVLKPWVDETEELDDFTRKLSELEGVDEVVFGHEVFNKLNAFLALFKLAGLLLGLGVSAALAFLVSSMVRMRLYARVEEVEILRLVGATGGFIGAPYVVEGAIQGLLGAFLGLGLLGLMHLAIRNAAGEALRTVFTDFNPEFLPLSWCGLVILFGIVLGAVSAAAAVSRFLQRAA